MRTQYSQETFRQSLTKFQYDIAYEAVTDHNVGVTCRNIAPLDIADEIETQRRGARFEQLVSLLHQFIALRLLFTVGKQSDAWRGHSKYTLHVRGTHQGELQQIFGFAIGIGSHIYYQANTISGRENPSQGWSIHSFDAFEGKERCSHHRATITCGNRTNRCTVAYQLQCQRHRGVFLAPDSRGGMFIHLDGFISMNNGQIKALGIVFGEFCANRILAAHQVDANTVFTSCLYRAQHNFARSVIASHSVQGNTDSCAHALFPSGPPMVVLTSSKSLSRSKGL